MSLGAAFSACVLSACILSACILSACILADKEIDIEDVKISNRTPVRLVEPVLLSEEAELACDPEPDDMKVVICPQPATDPRDVLPHYLDPNYVIKTDVDDYRPYYFCSCTQEGQTDARALIYTLYVEDQDEAPRSRDPKDPIYAALFLDLPPRTDKPDNYEDYPRHNNALTPLLPADLTYKPLYRRDPHLRQLVLGDTDLPLDLCNGGRTVLAPGLHTLTVMVTDRMWFTGENNVEQIGMPDVASGATFDSITYVFRCHDPAEPGNFCRCENPNEGGS